MQWAEMRRVVSHRAKVGRETENPVGSILQIASNLERSGKTEQYGRARTAGAGIGQEGEQL
jgi:hypothetical protein